MYKLIVNLDKLKINNVGIVKSIKLEEEIKRRISDLGVVKGTIIKPVFNSACGGIRAYEIRNILLAIRDEDARYIYIELC